MKCPYCQEEIKNGALKCRFCLSYLDGRDSSHRTVKHKVRYSPFLLVGSVFLLLIIAIPIVLGAKKGWREASEKTNWSPLSKKEFDLYTEKAKFPNEDDFFRYPSQYEGKINKYIGKIIQVISEGEFRVYIVSEYNEFLNKHTWTGDIHAKTIQSVTGNFLEDDVVFFLASGKGTISYKTTIGTNRTIPTVEILEMKVISNDEIDTLKIKKGETPPKTEKKEQYFAEKDPVREPVWNSYQKVGAVQKGVKDKDWKTSEKENPLCFTESNFFMINEKEAAADFELRESLYFRNKKLVGGKITPDVDTFWDTPIALSNIEGTPLFFGIYYGETWSSGFLVDTQKGLVTDLIAPAAKKIYLVNPTKKNILIPCEDEGILSLYKLELHPPYEIHEINLNFYGPIPQSDIGLSPVFLLNKASWITDSQINLKILFLENDQCRGLWDLLIDVESDLVTFKDLKNPFFFQVVDMSQNILINKETNRDLRSILKDAMFFSSTNVNSLKLPGSLTQVSWVLEPSDYLVKKLKREFQISWEINTIEIGVFVEERSEEQSFYAKIGHVKFFGDSKLILTKRERNLFMGLLDKRQLVWAE